MDVDCETPKRQVRTFEADQTDQTPMPGRPQRSMPLD